MGIPRGVAYILKKCGIEAITESAKALFWTIFGGTVVAGVTTTWAAIGQYPGPALVVIFLVVFAVSLFVVDRFATGRMPLILRIVGTGNGKLNEYGVSVLYALVVENSQTNVDTPMRGVTAMASYRHADGIDRFNVDRCEWFLGDVSKGFAYLVDLQSGERASVILALRKDDGRSRVETVTENASNPPSRGLKYGLWTVDVLVSGQNFKQTSARVTFGIERDGTLHSLELS